MAFSSIGDASRLFLQRRQSFFLKTEMQRLSQELSTGHRVRPATRTSGDTAHILGIERSLTRLAAHSTATAEVGHFVDVAQEALGAAQGRADKLGPAMLSAGSSANPTLLQSAAADAAEEFAGVVSALNSRAAERAVFSGTATGTDPLADPGTILAALRTATAGETTAAGIEAVVDDWFFASGGGFETIAYQGSTTGTLTFRVGDSNDIDVSARADSDAIRSLLKGFALAALVSSPGLSGDVTEQAALAEAAGTALADGSGKVVTLRADLGGQQARLEETGVRQAAEKTALNLAEAKFTEADPYETATALQAVQTQIETLYTLTAQQAHLNLAEYLR